jgi:hypothetical protein
LSSEELELIFKDNNKQSFSDFHEDLKCLLKLAYLADIYQHQHAGPKGKYLTSTDKLFAFRNKIQVWKKHLSGGNFEMFPLILQIPAQSDYKEVIPLIPFH